MIFKFLKHTVLALAVICFFSFNIISNEFVNILNEDYYGFEVTSGDDGWWMQQTENLSITNERGANGSSHSLKYTNATSFTGSKKAFGSTTISDMLIDLDPGIYDVSAMVWLASGSQISSVRANFRTAGFSDVNVVFNMNGIANDQWVKVTGQLNLTTAFTDTNVRIMFDSSATSIGTMYFDDLVILDEAPPVIDEIPSSAKIVTVGDNNLSLAKGNYDLSLKVWIDKEATIQGFYTNITEPWVSTKWEIDAIAKEEWVELKKQIVLEADAENSEFQIKVNNNPEYGGGKGVFYIDDINLVKTRNAYEEEDNFTIQVTGETCPDQDNGKIKITAKNSEAYVAHLNGVNYAFNEEIIIDNLAPNSYNLCINVEGTTFESCFMLLVEEGSAISGKIGNSKSKGVVVNVDKGTAPYTVSVNSNEVLTTYSDSFEVEAKAGDIIQVKSSKNCEGLLIEKINMSNGVRVYPNPVSNVLFVDAIEDSTIEVYNVLGELVYAEVKPVKRNKVLVAGMVSGLYFVKVISSKAVLTKKVLVK